MGVGFSWRQWRRERGKEQSFLVFVLVVSARSKESGLKFFFLVVSSKRRKGEGALLMRRTRSIFLVLFDFFYFMIRKENFC